MFLRVDANGLGDSKGTHLAVQVYHMKGEHDNQLQWPFESDIIMELLNWRENKGHHKAIGKIKSFYRVTEGEFGDTLGSHWFIPHSSLSYNPTTNTEYLQDDCLRLRVNVITTHQ